ncbi:zinc-finger homeodomain protein 6-like isoform X2 [Gastrolobium bilobum]|uniref:zinc-finger homeodomain protein 6-like isoform X2 n=1 Tax=Gastrolobium bilobum TaxID=150636 RepID=UPI002AB2631A|nr:zinc-finger homeodomain protein 6-like isoform X2 [Gastrolobium bilobum]
MEMRVQDKEIEMPTTLGYTNLPNRDSSSSSSKLSSANLASTLGERSTDQPSQNRTLIFNDPPQTSHHHHHHHYPPPLAPTHIPQAQRPTTDPDLSSSPIATTSTPIASGSNPTTTTTTPQQTTIATTILNPLIRYRECLRNHAASMGSHVVDGCGEFMPSGEEGTPESLRCAACECHRNFHRKEVEGEQPQHVPNYHNYYPNKHNGHIQFPQHHHHHRFSHVVTTTPTAGLIPPVMVAFGGGAAESSSEDLNMFQSNTGAQLSVQPPLSKKRFRTKFSQQQKDKMMEFAEKLGWKIQKHDEQEVQQFCSQVGVQRQVFKVWMHNNKQAMKKHQM